MMAVPPGSFWMLVESTSLERFTLNCGEQVVDLNCGEWHLLPAAYKPYADASVRATQSSYSRVKVTVWQPAFSGSNAG